MFDEKQIAYIAAQGKAESWPYPKIFHGLKEVGVTSHEVWVEDFRSVYRNGSQEWIESIPEGFHPLKVENGFNEATLENALSRRQNHETTYVEFLEEIAAAGIFSYKADMSLGTVTYNDRNENGVYTQNVPPYSS